MSVRDEVIEKAEKLAGRYWKDSAWVAARALFDAGLLATPAMVEAAKACEALRGDDLEHWLKNSALRHRGVPQMVEACHAAGRALVAERGPRFTSHNNEICENGEWYASAPNPDRARVIAAALNAQEPVR